MLPDLPSYPSKDEIALSPLPLKQGHQQRDRIDVRAISATRSDTNAESLSQ